MENKMALIKYSASVAAFGALGWHLYSEYQKKSISGQTWDEVAREKRRRAAAIFCAYVTAFHENLRLARQYLGNGRVDEALSILVGCLQGWQFKKQTLKALKKHLHPEFFAQLVNKLMEEKVFDCTELFGHLKTTKASHDAGLNINLN